MEDARKLDLRPLLALGAVVAVALTMWAAGAFAAGGSTSNGGPAATYVQTQDDNCPEHQGRGDGGGSGGDGSDSNGSGAGDL
jgi:hypothetical protein